MSYIYDLEPKHYAALLATKVLDIADKDAANAVGQGQIPPDSHNRTILIGLGGTGVQTLNHVKRVISNKLAPSWRQYVAFLAIDTDDNEFNNATHLAQEEFVKVTKPGIQATVAQGLRAYPKAWRPFVDEDRARELVGFGGNGAGRKRLMGKMKLHYKVSGSRGVDEEIVAKLTDRKNNVLEPFAPNDNGHYEVYVIGSVSGGTCSGSFLEMPALVRKALNAGTRVQMHAMLYLPDTLTALDPARADELMANGYASLKELDYFEGLSMREGTDESFVYNENAIADLKVTAADDFYTMPYLVGTRSGATSNSKEEACQTIAEFFISILGRMVPPGENAFMVDSFLNNALQHIGDRQFAEGNANMEGDGTDHSRPKRYGTVGFAQAAAPEQIVKAYTIAHACKIAGLEPISADTRAARQAAGETVLPFYGEDQFHPAKEVTRRTGELLKSLNEFMQRYQYTSFEYKNLFGGNPTWDEIRSGDADNKQKDVLVDNEVERLTGTEAVKALQQQVKDEFITFKNSVKAYVMEEGPLAFVNLYEGRAEKAEGDARAVGIRETLNALRDDLNLATNAPKLHPTVEDMLAEKQKKAKAIAEAAGGLGGWINDKLKGEKATQVTSWVNAYNAWVNARVNVSIRKEMLGTTGALNRFFIEPASLLCQQLYAFGKLMQIMSEGYASHGKALNKYEDFAKVDSGSAEVNIAALNHNVHAYLKEKAERNARAVDAETVRKALVESFFSDPDKWMEVDENNIERKGGGTQITLKNANAPISARYEFDRCLRQTINMDLEIKVAELFDNSGVDNATYAAEIINKLNRQSLPLFNGTLPANSTHQYIMYPQSLKQEVKTAIENAARTIVNEEVGFYATGYADAIMMYQMVAPFEMYNLAELNEWESQYESLIRNTGNGLHGRSPDLKKDTDERGTSVYSELTPWFDYPAITFKADPKSRNAATGEICHEGQVRIAMDEVIKKAKKKGILFSRKTNDGYVIERVHLDRSTEWRFDVDLLIPDEDTGLLPEGAELLTTVVEQNRKKLKDFTRTVRLAFAGQLTKPHDDEAWAWEYASRTLYAHRKMFIEIRETLELTESWFQAVAAYNTTIKASLNPAKMYKLLQADLLRQNKNGLWVFVDAEGRQAPVVNLSEARLEVLRDSKPREAALVDNGMSLYYIFTKLMKTINDEELNEALERANEMLNDDDYLDSDEYLTANKLAKTTLADELAKLKELGADVSEYNKPKKAFVANLVDIDITGKEMPVEIGKFYNKIQRWKTL